MTQKKSVPNKREAIKMALKGMGKWIKEFVKRINPRNSHLSDVEWLVFAGFTMMAIGIAGGLYFCVTAPTPPSSVSETAFWIAMGWMAGSWFLTGVFFSAATKIQNAKQSVGEAVEE
jgi:hypothetical protein